jgi:hypothetical protein
MNETISEDVIQEMIDDLVLRATDDWVMLVEVEEVVKRNAARNGLVLDVLARITTGLELIRRGNEVGLVIPGDVIDTSPGFVPWDMSLPDALERIEREWRAAGDNLQIGDVCWLANTPAGDVYAQVVRNRVDARRDLDQNREGAHGSG